MATAPISRSRPRAANVTMLPPCCLRLAARRFTDQGDLLGQETQPILAAVAARDGQFTEQFIELVLADHRLDAPVGLRGHRSHRTGRQDGPGHRNQGRHLRGRCGALSRRAARNLSKGLIVNVLSSEQLVEILISEGEQFTGRVSGRRRSRWSFQQGHGHRMLAGWRCWFEAKRFLRRSSALERPAWLGSQGAPQAVSRARLLPV